MKKTLIALLALAGIAAAGTEETITLQPTPQTACTWQPEFGIDYLHSVGGTNEDIDTQGVRASVGVTCNTDSPFSHQFSLNLDYRWGDLSENNDGILCTLDEKKTLITVGYDLNYAVTDKVTLFVGAKAGYVTSDMEVTVPAFNIKEDHKLEGFSYSVGGGVKYQITESVHVKAGYEFNRIYLGQFHTENVIANMHVISVGLGYKF